MFSNSKTFTISNLLSLVRLLSAVPLWFLFDDLDNLNTRFTILGFAFLGIATDYLDGYLARKYDQVSEVGKILDPIADKVLIGVVVIKLFILDEIPQYFFYMVIGRDLLIFIGGIILSARIGKVLPSNMIGKITVTVLSLLLILVIIQIDKSSLIFQSVYFSTLILIIVSFITYLIRAFEFINKKNYESV
ncbi:MAG: CDP-alcohol phosphatidyltransferase family protein [Ignavibacteria bacterium]|nr:CDP-alcohol phosphatidyltransferase family protein [Ignavibacteria bacterium]